MKYIFVAGGVISGVGKGVASASIGKILQARGFEVTAVKIDPYVNVDAGTMNPTEHGEVFVLDDGMECDQDMGNYERFLNRDLSKTNYITTGSIYLNVITRERNLEYKGKQVEVVPHIPLAVIEQINKAAKHNKADVVIVEIGGTVGEYQNILFLEAVRMLKIKNPSDVVLVLVSLMPTLEAGGTEIKTKPTQYAVRTLNAAGLQPDILIARARAALDAERKNRLVLNVSLDAKDIISAPNTGNIYEVALNFEKDHLADRILKKLNLKSRKRDLNEWRRMVKKIHSLKKEVCIGVVGKYFGSGAFTLTDSYISVLEAIKHAAYSVGVKPNIEWVGSEEFERDPRQLKKLSEYDGIVIPGGFGARGVEGKIKAIQYARTHGIPYFGLCYGMQLAVVEYARDVLHLKNAHTTEINQKTPHPVIDILPEQKEKLARNDYGGTMRLGAYPALLQNGTIAANAYGTKKISERHRHRFEVNPEYIEKIEKKGGVFSGTSPDRRLMEIFELPRKVHPFFLGTQFHPEFKSRPLRPHPLFVSFMKAAAHRSGR